MLKFLGLAKIFNEFLVVLEHQTGLVADYLEEALKEKKNE